MISQSIDSQVETDEFMKKKVEDLERRLTMKEETIVNTEEKIKDEEISNGKLLSELKQSQE